MSQDGTTNNSMDFLKNIWGNMGFSLPGMVTPTFDVEEIEKRIKDLKAVEGWLKMNLSMLQMTIQGLEMQTSTLNAVKAMAAMAPGQPESAATANPETPAGAMWPWNLMQQVQEQMQQQFAPEPPASPSAETPKSRRKPAKSA